MGTHEKKSPPDRNWLLVPIGWWEEAFANPPTPSEARGHPCGQHQMLMVVAYDITDRKRLARVAKCCEDYGIRVQYSVFECRLESRLFEVFWEELKSLIEPKEDRLVAYRICLDCSREVRSAGTMVSHQKVVAYVF